MDQDALNAVVEGRWKPLDLRWNLTAGLVERRHYHPKHSDIAQLQQAVANPGIVHFAGYLKPWIQPRLASRWAGDYVETLHQVFPEHRLDETLKSRCISFYDRQLRLFFYRLEHFMWKTMRGF